MADDSHVTKLKLGAQQWNKWRLALPRLRPNLEGEDLRAFNLKGADLTAANLKGTNLQGVNLTSTKLAGGYTGATASAGTDLSGANLSYANLCNVSLERVIIEDVNLYRAILEGTDFEYTIIGGTAFVDVDLSKALNLDSVVPAKASTVDKSTLERSGVLPELFLVKCGLSDWEIEAAKLHRQGLNNREIGDIITSVFSLRSQAPLQFYSCFISYAHEDEFFARQLYQRLKRAGVSCWFAPVDLEIAQPLSVIDKAIQLHDLVIVILSDSSIRSNWVTKEVRKAIQKEMKTRRIVLFPIRLDNSVLEVLKGWPGVVKKTRHIGDFRKWKSEAHFDESFGKLLNALKKRLNINN